MKTDIDMSDFRLRVSSFYTTKLETQRSLFLFFVNPSHHTTHTTKAERRAQESPRCQRRQRVARRPKVASKEKTRPLPPLVSGGSSPCKKCNRSHAHAAANKPLTTHTTHEHRASNGAKATRLNSRSRRRRPQAAAQRRTSALEPAAHQRNWLPPRENDSHRSSSRLKGGSARVVPVPQPC